MRRSAASPFANPVLIGAVTMLVVTVAVFLSYNANSGLPFVPTYQINVDVPSAANLVGGNEVRIGGARVGAISEITPRTLKDGRVIATLKLKLDKAVEQLPKDSTVVIRPKSLLGLKYVEITRGTSDEGFPPGATVPMSASRPPEVEFDELIDTFDEPTRKGIEGSTLGFGTALAGRGESINTAIGAFRPLLRDLLPVAHYLRDDKTGLTRLHPGAGADRGDRRARGRAAGRPVRPARPHLHRAGRASRRPSRSRSPRGPSTLDTSIRSFRVQRPFLEDSTRLMADLRPGVRALRLAAPDLSDALRIGRPVLLRTPALDRRLERLLISLKDFATDDVVPRGVADLTDTAASLRPTLAYLKPAQTTCNYVANWFRNVSDLLTVGDSSGTDAALHHHRHAAGPQQRGRPRVSGPPTARWQTTTCTSTRTRTRRRRASRRSARPATRPTSPASTVIGNTPGTEPASTDGNP